MSRDREDSSKDGGSAEHGADSEARLRELALLAASAAQDVAGPLTYLLSNLQYLDEQLAHHDEDLPPGRMGELRDCLREATLGAKQVQDIVRSMQAPRRSMRPAEGYVDLHRLLLTCIKVARMEIDHRARVITEFDAVPQLVADEAQLRRVFLNLIINAAQAVAGDPEKEHFIRVTTQRSAEGTVVVEVSDSGPGILDEHLPLVFEPFFTTKPAHEGTGLGLAVCRQVVAELGGDISVETNVGRGSTFRVRLPLDRQGPPPSPRSLEGRLTPSHPPVRRLPRRQLG